ncbi:MAG: hypothetical protein ACQETQ_04935 [Spirochaetota bacterium]
MANTPKIPKRFRKHLTQKAFEKRILGRVHLPKEREFLDRVFETGEDDTRRLSDSLGEEDRAHLARLDKDIRANHGSLRRMRLIALLVIIAVLVAFNLLFLDSILERSLERGLEAAFSARAEVTGLDLAPLVGDLSIDRITVGDRKRTMTNLFEIEAVSARVNVLELLKKNFVVHEASLGTVRTGTERAGSAALPSSSRDGTAQTNGTEGQSLLGRAQEAGTATLGGAGNLTDPQALVDQELAKLQTPRRIDEIREEIDAYSQRWTARVETLEQRSEETLQTVSRIRALEPGEIDTAEEVADSIALVRTSRRRITDLLDSAEQIADSTQTEYRQLQAATSGLQGALESDFDYIASQFSLSSVDVSGFTAGLAEQFLIEFLGEIYTTGERAMDIAERLKGLSSQRRQEPGLARAPGREVSFSSLSYPRFLLERAAVGVEPADRRRRFDGELSFLSSNPQLTGDPTRLSLSRDTGEVSLGLESELRYENGDPARLISTLSGSGLSFDPPAVPDFGRFSSTYLFDTTMELNRSDGARSVTSVELNELGFEPLETENPVVSAAQDVFAGLERVELNATFTVADRRLRLEEFQTSADDALRRGVRNTLAQRRDEYIGQAQNELRKRIEERREDLQPLLDRAAAIRERAREIERTLEDGRELTAEKRAELEQRTDTLVDKQRDKLEDEARERLDEATEDFDLDGLGF